MENDLTLATPEQQACIDDRGPKLKINACAGGGKTSTLRMKAEAEDVPSLYMAFNKVTAEEASQKFPKHVTCRTTHSLAYAAFGSKLRDKLSRPVKYVNVAGTGVEIGRYYKLDSFESAAGVTITAGHKGLLIRDTVARFEQSADTEITIDHVPYGELKDKFKEDALNIQRIRKEVLKYAQKLWLERQDTSSPVLATHDTYLKLYQLSKPSLTQYKILYVDEYQDTTPCVKDIVEHQATLGIRLVMVGDARQAIYGWRGAVNAMELTEAPTKYLTQSFRYGQTIADIATTVLQGAMDIKGNPDIQSVAGYEHIVDRDKPYARLSRTNSSLLQAAIQEIRKGTPIAIEIDVRDFSRLLESALNLSQGNVKNVKHEKIVPYLDWQEIQKEADNDPELKRIVKVVNDGQAAQWIELLSSFTNDRNPRIIFTTAHKSKGREFEQVVLDGDFPSCYNKDGDFVGLSVDEQNLLYVAVTRAINRLEYNDTVMEYLSYEKAGRTSDKEVKLKLARALKGIDTINGEHAQYAMQDEEGDLW